jgi:hypothetical protein
MWRSTRARPASSPHWSCPAADHPALRRFLADAGGKGAILAGISQGCAVLPPEAANTVVAATPDDLPKFARALLTAVQAQP